MREAGGRCWRVDCHIQEVDREVLVEPRERSNSNYYGHAASIQMRILVISGNSISLERTWQWCYLIVYVNTEGLVAPQDSVRLNDTCHSIVLYIQGHYLAAWMSITTITTPRHWAEKLVSQSAIKPILPSLSLSYKMQMQFSLLLLLFVLCCLITALPNAPPSSESNTDVFSTAAKHIRKPSYSGIGSSFTPTPPHSQKPSFE
jgi:hypothetical protein